VTFGWEVFQALGLAAKLGTESDTAKSEVGSFVTAMFKARGQVPQHLWAELAAAGLKTARHIGKHGRTATSPGAVWHSIFTREIKARAGPVTPDKHKHQQAAATG
jgi:hypothetical protein